MKRQIKKFFKDLGKKVEECSKCKGIFEPEEEEDTLCDKCKTATFIKDLDGFTGAAKLYHLNPKLRDRDGSTTEYVVISATVVPFSGPETYIFASDKNGRVSDYGEWRGSFRGALDHERALREAGYEKII